MSDVIGFILVFSLIAASVGLVSVVGFSELQAARDAERLQNAERAFDVLGDNVEDVYRGGAPSRATEIKLADATLGFGGTTEITVTVDGTSFTRTLRPIVYEAAGTRIVYEAGAVIRADRVGARMIRDPSLLVTSDATAMQMARTVPDPERNLGGRTTVLIRVTRTSTSLLNRSSGDDVSLEIETTEQRAPAWKRYFDDTAIGDCAVSGGTVTCPASGTFTPAEFSLVSTRMEVELVP
ncbi:MAG: hypothetical protein ABEI11_03930 [Haloarculaceae archaeon]